jgi:hypothetical protein
MVPSIAAACERNSWRKLYLDLADADWHFPEIDAKGWRPAKDATVRFRRPSGMVPLPMPTRGGTTDMLRPFVNIRDDDDFALVAAWLRAALRDQGPYPVLCLTGVKSAPLRALPREDRDLFIAATNGHVMCFDNVSGLPA